VITEPPLLAGCVNDTVAVVAPVADAVPIVGASGTVIAVVVIELLAALGELVPIAFVAVTVKVYEVLAERPVTLMVPEPAWLRVPVMPPGLLVAV